MCDIISKRVCQSIETLNEKTELLDDKRRRYEWTTFSNLPLHPPWIEDFSRVRCESGFTLLEQYKFETKTRFYASFFIPINLLILGLKKKLFGELGYAEHEYTYGLVLHKPRSSAYWEEDWWFGYQRLGGVHTNTIKRIYALPENMGVDLDRLEELLPKGKDLESELKLGRFFIEDLQHLEGVKFLMPGRLLSAPISLFYLLETGDLTPMAIQLNASNPKTSPGGVFYPNDLPIHWKWAKMGVQCALAADHQIGAHLVLAHYTGEIFGLATHRALPPSHPVFRLLELHVEKTMDINERARNFLIPEVIRDVASAGVEGSHQLAEIVYSMWHFENHYPKRLLESKGLYDPSLPLNAQRGVPSYPYRDNAFPLWDLIREYVGNALADFYTDATVRTDEELKDWANEFQALNMKGFPARIETVEKLQDVLTMIIYTTSVFHSSVNFPQYESLGWVPNMPLAIYAEHWPSREEITQEFVDSTLPSFLPSSAQTAAVSFLSQPLSEGNNLVHIDGLIHPSLKRHAEAFRKKLEIYSKEVKAKYADVPDHQKYTYLDPEFVPLSVAI